MARILSPLAVVALVACGAGISGTKFVSARPVQETMDCLVTALDSAEYRVIRLDRRRGNLDARRDRDDRVGQTDLREFKKGDRLEVTMAKDKKTFAVMAGSYTELRSQLGSSTEFGAPTTESAKDATFLAGRCAVGS